MRIYVRNNPKKYLHQNIETHIRALRLQAGVKAEGMRSLLVAIERRH